jgi:hypothetical protein
VNDLTAVSFDEALRIAHEVGMSATGVQRVLAGTVDGPQAARIRALAVQAIGRAPARLRIRHLEAREVLR